MARVSLLAIVASVRQERLRALRRHESAKRLQVPEPVCLSWQQLMAAPANINRRRCLYSVSNDGESSANDRGPLFQETRTISG